MSISAIHQALLMVGSAAPVSDPAAPFTMTFNDFGTLAGEVAYWGAKGVVLAGGGSISNFFDSGEIDLPYALNDSYYLESTGVNFSVTFSPNPSKGIAVGAKSVRMKTLAFSVGVSVILDNSNGGSDTFAVASTSGGLFVSLGPLALSDTGAFITAVTFSVPPGTFFIMDSLEFLT